MLSTLVGHSEAAAGPTSNSEKGIALLQQLPSLLDPLSHGPSALQVHL